MNARLVRTRSLGSSMIELPLTIWILILGFALPLTALGTIGMRYNFVLNAARDAATAASLAKTFEQDADSIDLSAKTRGINTANHSCQAFTGISLTATPEVWLIGTPLPGGSSTTQPIIQQTKLARAADSLHLYEVEVAIKASINPLFTMPSTAFGINIPGLTAPFPVEVRSRAISENPQGLHY